MPLVRVLGIGFGALGVFVVISGGQLLEYRQGLAGQPGDGYILLSAVNWAVFTVVSKRWLFDQSRSTQTNAAHQQSPFASMIKQMLMLMIMGWLFLLPWVIAEGGMGRIAYISSTSVVALLFLGVACSGLAYIFWYGALTRIDATETGALLYFEPLVTQAVAWPLLGEPLTLVILIGGGAIFIGVWMVGKH
jgi:drug/metabolite transporter (DMT)-like permease